jgi:hypothetical protein
MTTSKVEINLQEPTGPDSPGTIVPEGGDKSTPVERPTGLPEKFKTVADMVAAYSELEKMLGTSPKEPKEVVNETVVEETAAVDFDKYTTEFFADGAISEESYAELAKQGYSKQVVDTFIEGKQIKMEQTTKGIYEAAGGEEMYESAIKWASDNWTLPKQEAFNAIFDGTNTESAKFAVQALVSEFKEKGAAPNLISGEQGNIKGGTRYESYRQFLDDVKTKQYKTDPAFRDMVDKKLQNSPNI